MRVSISGSSCRSTSEALDKDLDWQGIVDPVGAVVLVMIVRLDAAIRTVRPRQQRVSPRLLRRKPVKLPASPRIPLNGIEKFCVGPSFPTVRAHRDPRYLGFPCPRNADNQVSMVRYKCFVNTGSGDLRLQFHFSQCPPHRLSIQIVPVPVV